MAHNTQNTYYLDLYRKNSTDPYCIQYFETPAATLMELEKTCDFYGWQTSQILLQICLWFVAFICNWSLSFFPSKLMGPQNSIHGAGVGSIWQTSICPTTLDPRPSSTSQSGGTHIHTNTVTLVGRQFLLRVSWKEKVPWNSWGGSGVQSLNLLKSLINPEPTHVVVAKGMKWTPAQMPSLLMLKGGMPF